MSRFTEQVTIVEIRKRAEQGVTLPFYCRGSDNHWYWVKGNCAGKRALCCEWVAGRIAREFGLPIPPFAKVMVPSDLIEYSAMENIADLGFGWCFGSRNVQDASEFSMSNIPSVDDGTKLKLLIFDWWVQNEDRTLGPMGGNVNLLWTAADSAVHVIDHNIAFESDFHIDRFMANHVFSPYLQELCSLFTLEIAKCMKDIAGHVRGFWEELPEEWTEEAVLSPAFSFDILNTMVNRFGNVASVFGAQ